MAPINLQFEAPKPTGWGVDSLQIPSSETLEMLTW